MAKRANGIASFATNGSLLQWDFDPGVVSVECGEFFTDYANLTDVQRGIVFNGIKQKLQDSVASCKTAAERFERMTKTLENLRSGVWASRGDGSGGELGIVAMAIADVKGKPFAAVLEFLRGKSKAEIAALAASPKYAEAVAELRRAKASNVDVEDLESGIDDI